MPDLHSTITCPECGVRTTEMMPTDACQYFYDCRVCGAVLKPLKGDCCVFCSYGGPALSADSGGARKRDEGQLLDLLRFALGRGRTSKT